MAGDDGKVIDLPSVDDLLANPKRYHPPGHWTEVASSRPAVRPPESRKDAGPPTAPLPVATAAAEGAPPGGGPEHFDAESGDYKAFGWPGNKAQPSLIKDGAELGFNYADLATAYPGGCMFVRSAPGRKGNVIRLLFHGDAGLFAVVLEGIGLRPIWGLLMGHRTPWIHELPDGAEFGHGEPVIRSVSFQIIEPERAASGKAGRADAP